MWDNEKATETAPIENVDDNNDFGDDFDDFAEEGGDDDFGDFDEAEEATPVPPPVEANPPAKAIAPSVLDSLPPLGPDSEFSSHHQMRSSRLTLTPYSQTQIPNPLVYHR